MQMSNQDADVSVNERDNIRDVNDIKLNVKINASSQPETVASPTQDDTINNRLRHEMKSTRRNKRKAKANRRKPRGAPEQEKVQNIMRKPSNDKKGKNIVLQKEIVQRATITGEKQTKKYFRI